MIYAIRCARLGAVKIGWSRQIRQRVIALASAVRSDLVLVALMPGARWQEQRAHAELDAARMAPGSEWFLDCPLVRAWIDGQRDAIRCDVAWRLGRQNRRFDAQDVAAIAALEDAQRRLASIDPSTAAPLVFCGSANARRLVVRNETPTSAEVAP